MSNIEDGKQARLVLTLYEAKGAAPFSYLSQMCDIDDHMRILEQLEENGIVERIQSNSSSASKSPQFVLKPEVHNQLQLCIATRLEQLIAGDVEIVKTNDLYISQRPQKQNPPFKFVYQSAYLKPK
jgi:hypothetical protein